MKTPLRSSSAFLRYLFIFVVAVGFNSCQDQVESTYTYQAKIPVSIKTEVFRDMYVGPVGPRDINRKGKIYIFNDFLFIGEPNKGIHVIDNTNPANPTNISFIEIPGAADLAINDNILYADSYIDLLSFDISDPRDISLVNREEDVFTNFYIDQEAETFTYYKDTVITSKDPIRRWGGGGIWLDAMSFSNAEAGGGQGNYGQGGSMARFTLANEHLYTVDDSELRLFDISDKADPEFVKQIPLGWGIETIFPFKDKLFIGSTTGMHIYDISVPAAPQQLSVYSHITSCDPVVANDDYAFVTLRSGNFCQQGVNLLEVLDITDPSLPKLLKSYPMDNPHGLGLAGDYLYVCEGEYGLKSFNVSDVLKIDENQLEHLKGLNAFDLIPGPKSLIVIGNSVITQYDYSTPSKLKQLSTITIK
ncbi:LVIVD repeat-containing protein [Echinicola vietnamensis]|uniref:LVIVD repeat protein n=1 Tax=Echinicola vietnamensis (strain DSM 17526 / LMG 23754 / KMM 6221) TaxID=926556 RepID=L0G5L7_ECHVK|nr:hypothetical protein [Echinicola vietnamensis]AGA80842.1 hypothetical protein Echvi_4675 [Echinicola vietnamensis DSM 17526]